MTKTVLENLEEYFEKTPKEQIEKDWEETQSTLPNSQVNKFYGKEDRFVGKYYKSTLGDCYFYIKSLINDGYENYLFSYEINIEKFKDKILIKNIGYSNIYFIPSMPCLLDDYGYVEISKEEFLVVWENTKKEIEMIEF